MSTEQLAAMLANLKTDLGVTTTAYDTRLSDYIRAAASFITEQGAALDYDSVQDAMLIVQYAAWTWRRRDTGEGMPRMLRYALNNRIFAPKMQESDG